jgi:hypothetical protein
MSMGIRKRAVNVKFVVRGLFLALLLAGALLVAWLLLHGFGPAEPTPPPPTILAPAGEWPTGARSFEEWAGYDGEPEVLAGSGFLLALDGGRIVGATTAHSLGLDDPAHRLESVRFKTAGQPNAVAEFSHLHGSPGVARTGDDMTVDYVLLQPQQPIDDRWVLRPDSRGAPQPGERVTLLSGQGSPGAGSAPRLLDGVVQSVDEHAVWVTMDELFGPGLMSGSPFVSRHTGRVVGMLIAGALRGNRLLLAAHPIGSLVKRAQSAGNFPALAAYRR